MENNGVPVTNGVNISTSLAEILIEAAQPDRYRLNAFRELELPVDCKEMDISRRQKMIEIANKTSSPVPAGPGHALPLEQSDDFSYKDAIQRLRDPERRFIDEFFWFWPHELGDGKGDEALAALQQDDLEEAVEVWTYQANNDSANNVSMHNLAVLAHASALDLELNSLQRQLSDAQLKKLDIYWRQAFKRWRSLLGHEGFWQRLRARVREFGDPRLNSDTVDNMRSILPMGLLLINARMAIQAAEHADQTAVQRHLQTMRLADFESYHLENALMRAVEPLRERVKTFCKTAENESNSDPVHANQTLRRLLEQTTPLLSLIDQLLPSNTPARDATHDEVALRGLSCLQAFVNKTDSWREALKLAEQFLPLAASQSARSRIEENIKSYKGNLESGNDWCGEGYYELPEEIITPLEKAHEYAKTRQWDQAIPILEGLINQKAPPLPAQYVPLVNKPLAFCLNLRSVERLNTALDKWNAPRAIIDKIRRQANVGGYKFLMTAMALQTGTEQTAARQGNLVCMACGVTVTRWATFTFNKTKFLVCPACNVQDDAEMESRRRELKKTVTACAEDLLRAQDLDPSNKRIDEILAQVRKLASDLNLTLPTRAGSKPPQSASSATSAPRSTTAPASRPAARLATSSRTRSKPGIGTAASVMQHLGAFLMDFLVLGIVLGMAGGIYSSSKDDLWMWLGLGLIVLYYPFCYGAFKRTLGEKVSGTRVVNKQGDPISFGLGLWRSILFFLIGGILSGITAGFGAFIYLLPAVNKDHRNIADFIAGTTLVKA